MKYLIAIAFLILAVAFENQAYCQEPGPPARQSEPALEQPVVVPPPARQIEPSQKERAGIKQVGPRQPERGAARPQILRERGARPEIVRPGGRPAGAGRPQGARRPVRR